MFKKIKDVTVTLIASLMLAVPVLAPAMVHAQTEPQPNIIQQNLCNGLNVANGADVQPGATQADGTANPSCNTTEASTGVNGIIHTVINIFSLIVGAISVIMIIYGGFKYITSGGDSGNVGGAKNTIIYALIGLVIVALAQIIVRFVLTKAVNNA